MTASGLENAPWRAGWRSFRAAPERVLVPVLAAGFGWVLVQLVAQLVISGTVTRSHPCVRNLGGLVDPTRCAAGASRREAGILLTILAACFLGQLFWAVALRAAQGALSATPPLRSVLGPVLGTATLVAAAVTLGFGFGPVPGLLAAFFSQTAMTGAVLEGRDCLGAVAGSWVRWFRQPLVSLGWAGLAVATLVIGLALGLVGVWPATAVIALAHAHRYGPGPGLPEK